MKKICVTCGKEFEPGIRHIKKQKYCSKSCYLKTYKPRIVKCKECGEIKPLRGHGMCGACIAKEWYYNNHERQLELHKIWKRKHPQNKLQVIRNRDSKLKKLSKCLFCGKKEKIVFHHLDYELGLGITLCQSHHREQHSGVMQNPL